MFTFQTESDKEKFEYLYEKYKKLLLYKAYGILKNPVLAEDAVSEAYIRIYRNLHKIEDPKSNQTISFLVTIAVNAALTLLKKECKYVEETSDERTADDFNLEQQVLSQIGTEQIYQMINSIGEDLRSVFLLKYAHGLKHKEIAAMLNISENNVTVRIHRAKKRIIDILKKEGYGHG